MEFEKDESQWPLVIFNIKGNFYNCSKENFDNFLLSWSEIYIRSSKEKQKFRLILNALEVESMNMKLTMELCKFLKECRPLAELWMVKTGLLLEGKIMKHILDFVFSIYKPARPFQLFEKKEDVLQWVNED